MVLSEMLMILVLPRSLPLLNRLGLSLYTTVCPAGSVLRVRSALFFFFLFQSLPPDNPIPPLQVQSFACSHQASRVEVLLASSLFFAIFVFCNVFTVKRRFFPVFFLCCFLPFWLSFFSCFLCVFSCIFLIQAKDVATTAVLLAAQVAPPPLPALRRSLCFTFHVCFAVAIPPSSCALCYTFASEIVSFLRACSNDVASSVAVAQL